MTMKKFITMDLQTGKKILQTIEASYIKFSDNRLPGSPSDLDTALKAEITRALAAEQKLTADLAQEVKDARNAEKAIKALIGELGEKDSSVKAAIDRIDNLITALTAKVTEHVEDEVRHITADERTKWNKAVDDVATKADDAAMTRALATKVATDHLMTSDGKIKAEHLPSIAVNSVQTVTNEEEAMRLVVENGDVVIINPDAKVTKNKSKVVKGTFICVNDKEDTFEKKFRQLYSNTDSISKAEVTNLIKVETDRAKEVEAELVRDIATINGGEEVTGSIQHAVSLERDRAKDVEKGLDDRLKVVEPIVTKLNGDESVSGSAANLAKAALTEAKAHTDAEIRKVNTAAEELSGRVQTLETTVGNDGSGLVKDVKELQGQVSVINGEQEGSIKKALADAKTYADTQVTNERTAREQADTQLSARLDSLEANENLAIKLGFVGVEQHDLLAVRAGNTVVKATLADSNVVGIVVRAAGPNSKTVVSGRVGGFNNLIPGKSYFLGSNGQITDQMPTNVNEHIIKIGVALTTTDLFVNIEEAIEIRA